jgi:hypothetical protein
MNWAHRPVEGAMREIHLGRINIGPTEDSVVRSTPQLSAMPEVLSASDWVKQERVWFFEKIMPAQARRLMPPEWKQETAVDVISLVNAVVLGEAKDAEPSEFFSRVFETITDLVAEVRRLHPQKKIPKNAMFRSGYAKWRDQKAQGAAPKGFEDRVHSLLCAAIEYITEIGTALFEQPLGSERSRAFWERCLRT